MVMTGETQSSGRKSYPNPTFCTTHPT